MALLAAVGLVWPVLLLTGVVPVRFRRFLSASWEIGVFGKCVAVVAVAVLAVAPPAGSLVLLRRRPGLAGLAIAVPMLLIGVPALAAVVYLVGTGTGVAPTGAVVVLAATLCPVAVAAAALGWRLESRARRIAEHLRQSAP